MEKKCVGCGGKIPPLLPLNKICDKCLTKKIKK
jgi:hypothetical protein